MTLVPPPAFADNNIWMLHDGSRAFVADAVDARREIDALADTPLQLAAILVTHHDADRTLPQPPRSFASVAEPAGGAHTPSGLRCKTSHTPGRPTSRWPLPLPSGTATGRRIPPFLRSREATVIAAVHEYPGPFVQAGEIGNNGAVATLRQWKNDFR